MRSSSATASEKMDPAATTTLHPRSFSCESRHYREKKKEYQMSYSPPLTKSFHYDTFFFFFIWHKCLLDQELICQLFLFWFLFSFSFYTFFLKTRVCSSLRLFCRSGGAFVIRVFHYAERLIQKQTFIHFFFLFAITLKFILHKPVCRDCFIFSSSLIRFAVLE